MSEKRALIVDDSKSARVVLSRMLEKYELAVDTSDSAEHALEYLKAHRPDVIFMDHMMPGMDGLAAVQAIRSNPDTSAIPIMMYTSQEGELYLGQARALGATGVLPKRIGATEVSRILQDLRLLAAPSTGSAGAGTAAPSSGSLPGAHSGPIIVPAPGASDALPPPQPSADSSPGSTVDATAAALVSPAPAVRVVAVQDLQQMLEPLLKQHSADLRRFVVASLDSFSGRVVTEIRDSARPAAAPPAAPVVLAEPAPALPAPAAAHRAARPSGWIALAAVASTIAVAAGAFAGYQQRQIDALVATLAAARSAPLAAAPALVERVPAPPATGNPPGAAPADASTPAGASVPATGLPAPTIPSVAFPYGAPPFADERLDRLATVLGDLERRGARGVLTATLHAGEFCLTGNPAEGYALAPDEMPADGCDVVGNPHYDGLRAAQRQGAGYAEMVAALRARAAGALDVRVVDAARQGAVTAYPSGGGASAQQWNAAAAANQRIEFTFAPAPGDPP